MAAHELIERTEKQQAKQEFDVIEKTSLKIEPTRTMDALLAWATKHSVVLPITDLGRYPIFMILTRAKGEI